MVSIGNSIKISVCIPTYEMGNVGAKFLDFCLETISEQSHKNYEVIISDHSTNDEVFFVAEKYRSNGIDLKYLRNEEFRGNASKNLNNCMLNSSGDVIKILFQDDFLYYKHSLRDIAQEFFQNPSMWLVTSCCHTIDGHDFYRYISPQYTKDIITGNNLIGSPSVLSIRNLVNIEFFDPQFKWLMDCDYYQRLYNLYGEPFYLNKTNVVIRKWEGQLTQSMHYLEKEEECKNILIKYNYQNRPI